ncbi:hypothetical protein D9758_000253 [Tetrapyrgos nigripes]|uniref:YDG domain-containing protein n=1 Tax=Tetrapyrgos nigripes TaxID=182062 RepID=A0A8H5H1K7_9AGAR|nr:hypothetical protein D9758_000253 [Tetrapyrgos nigripes]
MSEILESAPALAQLSRVLDDAPEYLVTGSKRLQNSALQATKYLFDLSVDSETASFAHIEPLLNSFSPSSAPQTRSQTRKRKRSPSPAPPQIVLQPTPLGSLFVEGLDEDQIWSQLDLRARNVCDMLDHILEADPEEEEDENKLPIDLDEEKITELLERIQNGEDIDLDKYGLDEESLDALLEQSGYFDDEDSDEDEDSGDEDENEEESAEGGPEEEVALRDESSDEEDNEPKSMLDMISNKRNGKLKVKGNSELDDAFFDLAAFNAQSEAAEARKVSAGHLDESDEDADEDIDFFAPVDDADIEEEECKLVVPSNLRTLTVHVALFYNDFFKPPRSSKAAAKKSDAGSVRFRDEVRVRKIKAKGKNQPISSMYLEEDEDEDEDEDETTFSMGQDDETSSEESGEESDEEESDLEEESEPDLIMDDTIQRLQDDLFADEEHDSQRDLSTHEKRMQALQEQISQLEQENVGEKDWVLMGEAGSRSRPQNSLLEEDLEFERVQKAVPVITEEVVQDLEERIKARILENRFDDVVRVRPLEDKPFLPSRVFELKDTKSTQSLAQIYEDEYIAARSGGSTGDAVDEKLRKEHQEVERLWEGICSKLDALCNAYYTPKQPKATISTVTDVSTASLESALPTTQSAATMLAPEEIFAPSSSDSRARSELTPAEKQALRRKERKAKKKTRDALNLSVDKYAKMQKKGGVKKQKEDALKSVVKSGKGVTVSLLSPLDSRFLLFPGRQHDMASRSERERNANIARNKALLESIGVNKPLFEPKEIRHHRKTTSKKRKAEEEDSSVEPPQKAARAEQTLDENDPETAKETASTTTRRSTRIKEKKEEVKERKLLPSEREKLKISEPKHVSERKHSPNVFGSIPGIEVGTWWESRQACSLDAIHAPWVAGISGGNEGAYSVALSGGYEDDVDLGYGFTYTGSGGRDLKGTKANPKNLRTAPQSSDQTFDDRMNRALKRSSETKKPVRVIRGYKLNSPYAPSEGYRYDGLYSVERAWMEKGLNPQGYLVCKFAFKRLPNQPDLLVRDTDESESS